MIYYHILVLVVVAVMGIIALINVLVLRSLNRRDRPTRAPFVSVLVPARNEAAKIGLCLSALAEQDYPQYEVIVLDDASEDATLEIAREWSRSFSYSRVMSGKPLPSGWVGKAFACHQLANEAKGELLLFVDADTVLGKESITASVAALFTSRADLLTVIPHQKMESFWERVVLPLLHFSTYCFLPLPLVRLSKSPKLAMANGQFMLFKRDVYEDVGGHEAVRTAIVEDVWLSRRVKQAGYALEIMDGGELVSCRMYSSLKEIWSGFSKNLFAGFRYSIPAITAMVVFNLLTSVVPFVMLAGGFLGVGVTQGEMIMVLGQVLTVVLIRALLAVRLKMSLLSTVLHPLAMVIMVGIAVNSCRWVLASGGAQWKGRQYNFRKRVIIN